MVSSSKLSRVFVTVMFSAVLIGFGTVAAAQRNASPEAKLLSEV
jgi:hypothetical protein